nr:putative reverse transcriptase domain-containing protein [Tanacetum cinerariifolium]
MEILLEPTSNKLMVAGNPVKDILLKLNLPDHMSILTDSKVTPITHGRMTKPNSFDVIVGMNWLSKGKFVIVRHEKVVRIPLEGDEILRVHGKRTQGVVKTLMNTK